MTTEELVREQKKASLVNTIVQVAIEAGCTDYDVIANTVAQQMGYPESVSKVLTYLAVSEVLA